MNWNRVLREIREALVRPPTTPSPQATRRSRSAKTNVCLFWDCDAPIRPDHTLCLDHFHELRDGLIDECPGCGSAKYTKYGVCLDCYDPNECLYWDCDVAIPSDHVFCVAHFKAFQEGQLDECPGCGLAKLRRYDVCLKCRDESMQPARSQQYNGTRRWYRPEYSPAWEAGDAAADRFYVYILKLDGGEFYPGQTRELRERLSEHRDGRTKSTSGKNPRMVWFTTVETRDEATKLESELKKLVDRNPREIRRMIVEFQDLVRELDYA